MIVVIDTSLALQWLVPEPDSERAEALLQGYDLAAPEVLLVEAANVLGKKVRAGQIGIQQATEGIEFLTIHIPRLVPVTPLTVRALEISVAIAHPVYDCMFLACAESLSGLVATRDRPFARRAITSGFADLIMPESAS